MDGSMKKCSMQLVWQLTPLRDRLQRKLHRESAPLPAVVSSSSTNLSTSITFPNVTSNTARHAYKMRNITVENSYRTYSRDHNGLLTYCMNGTSVNKVSISITFPTRNAYGKWGKNRRKFVFKFSRHELKGAAENVKDNKIVNIS
jgi:hypothetical protein